MQQFSFNDYGAYLEQDFRHRWLRPALLREKLEKYRRFPSLQWEILGRSEEGRPIESIRFGEGAIKVLAWTQMHGNEPTATMALIDLLNFLTNEDEYDPYRRALQQHFTILFIPMLNPDGAERFSRRNALNIDPNRDALRWQSAEMQIFRKEFDRFQPHWAFNLHDQRNFFSVGNTGRTATISFLAASENEERELTAVRRKSMQLIAGMWRGTQHLIPGHFGRYTDEFYPAALGEFFHIQKVPCVLIESGAYPDDPHRDMARKLNFCLILQALELIQSEGYTRENLQHYFDIPENGKNLFDLIIRNCRLVNGVKTIRADLGFMYQETVQENELVRKLILTDIGDLSYRHGIAEQEGGAVAGELQLDKPAHFHMKVSGKEVQFENGYRNEKHQSL